jgi:hypothetical protein
VGGGEMVCACDVPAKLVIISSRKKKAGIKDVRILLARMGPLSSWGTWNYDAGTGAAGLPEAIKGHSSR